ncbi:MAG TPA: hypothetical protein DCS66_05735 [Flavobacteriaceae bacterium]|nr:hypothetical protein [Flavobacteriaceae bacterium]|tara:strand:- start:5292 stop:6107 length:816 start_codon:yes stop_codon:yes gene_type:complete
MVNQAEQDNTSTPEVTQDNNNGDTLVDVTSEFEGADTFTDTSAPTEEVTDTPPPPENTETSTETPTETPVEPVAEQANTSTETPPVTPVPQEDTQTTETRLRELETKNAAYEQQQQQSQLQSQAGQYAQQLEKQGYLPDQANQIATQWMAQQSRETQLAQQQQDQIRYVQGQAAAAEHFATKYDLKLSDLSELKKYDSPPAMEEAAKSIQANRAKDARIAELEAKLVPPQSFDSSQSTPGASNSNESWLDKYNSGDRSPNALAAARRATGL